MKAKNGWRENVRIIWAITAKDILEALKNKNTITVIITSLLMVAFYRYSAILFRGNEPLNVLVFDAGEALGEPSTLLASLKDSSSLDVYTGYTSADQMKEKLANGEVPELGLVIPEGFNRSLDLGEVPNLQGYVLYWVTQEDAARVKGVVEAEIARFLGTPVPIQLDGNVVYAQPDSGGLGVQAGIAVVFVLTMIGLSLVGHLILEEKQSRTLEVLLVSPASAGQVVAGKALTGIFYCLIGAGVALVLNQDLIIHWWLAILAVLCGSVFSVSLGLLLGTYIENRGQLTLWAWVILVPMLIPLFLSLLAELLPPPIIPVIRIIPTVVLLNLLRASVAISISLGTNVLQLAWVAACGGAVLMAVAWLLRRQDRGAEEVTGHRLALVTQGAQRGLTPAVDSLPAGQFHSEASQAPQGRADQPRLAVSALVDRSSRVATPGSLRLIGAIAWKDIRDAIQNKIVLSIIMGVGLMIVSNAFIPLLLRQRDLPTAMVYDPGHSIIVQGLAGRDDFRLGMVDSREELEAAITESQMIRLGLIIPVDFDQRVAGAQEIVVKGYAAHSADSEQIEEWAVFFEEQIGLVSGGNVRVDLDEDMLYPRAEAGGQVLLAATLVVVVIMAMGISLVPLLIVEEKEAHTLDSLLVTPAGYLHVIAGKALTGFVYCLVAAVVLFFVYQPLFVSTGILLVAILTSIAFTVAGGLFIGMLSDNPTTTGMWGALLLLILIASAVLDFVSQAGMPAVIQSIANWMPGSLMVNLVRAAMAGKVTASQWLVPAAKLTAEAGLVYLSVVWLLRRQDR